LTVKVVVDTAILIDHLRGDDRAAALLLRAVDDGSELWSITVVRTEILAGMRDKEARATRRLLSSLRWQPVTVELADRAGALARRYLKSHPGVDTVDYLIAAGTQLLDAGLWTLNVKHFPMFDALAPAYGALSGMTRSQ
jgi:predicted nucleic acid-binding protein